MKTWIKYGLIGGVLYFILAFVLGPISARSCFGDPIGGLCSLFNIFIWPNFVMGKIITMLRGFTNIRFLLRILGFLFSFIFSFSIGFVVGAIIGLIIEKVKK